MFDDSWDLRYDAGSRPRLYFYPYGAKSSEDGMIYIMSEDTLGPFESDYKKRLVADNVRRGMFSSEHSKKANEKYEELYIDGYYTQKFDSELEVRDGGVHDCHSYILITDAVIYTLMIGSEFQVGFELEIIEKKFIDSLKILKN